MYLRQIQGERHNDCHCKVTWENAVNVKLCQDGQQEGWRAHKPMGTQGFNECSQGGFIQN